MSPKTWKDLSLFWETKMWHDLLTRNSIGSRDQRLLSCTKLGKLYPVPWNKKVLRYTLIIPSNLNCLKLIWRVDGFALEVNQTQKRFWLLAYMHLIILVWERNSLWIWHPLSRDMIIIYNYLGRFHCGMWSSAWQKNVGGLSSCRGNRLT